MKSVTFDNGVTYYDIPDEVHKYLKGYYDKAMLLSEELEHLQDMVRIMKLKEETMIQKPRKSFRMAYYAARQELYNMLPKGVKQQKELFK